MKTYRVYGLWTASKFIGEFEANSEEEAIAMAEDSDESHASLCHYCSKNLDLSDLYPYKFEAEEA